MLSHFSRAQFFVTSWSVARQALLSMGFPGKNTGVGCHFLLQEIFPTQGLNPGLPHCRQTLYHLSHLTITSFLPSLLECSLLYTKTHIHSYTFSYTYVCIHTHTHTQTDFIFNIKMPPYCTHCPGCPFPS